MVMRRVGVIGWIILSWAVTDIIRAGVIFADGEIHTTTLHILTASVGPLLTACLCLGSAIAAGYAVFARKSNFGFFSLIFQQAMLVLFAVGPIAAIISSSYADGVIRPRGFILADQFPHVTPVVVHFAAVIGYWITPWTNRGDKKDGK